MTGREDRKGLRAAFLAALVTGGLCLLGCEKPPSLNELFGNKKETPAVASKPAPTPAQPAPKAPKPPEPPQKTPQEVIAAFQKTPPELRTDAQLIELAALKEGPEQFVEMDLTHSGVGDKGMAVLPKFENLQKLIIDACRYDNNALHDVALIKNLTSLSMKGGPALDRMQDAGLAQLKDMKQLKELRIDRVFASSSGFSNSIDQMEGLELLAVPDTQFYDQDLNNLSRLVQLKELDLSGTFVTDAGCEYLMPLVNLEVLRMSRLKNFRGQGLLELTNRGRLKKLRVLSLYNDHELMEPAYQAIRKLKTLESLDVTHSALNDHYLVNAIIPLSKLEDLSFGDIIVTDEGMKSLPRLKNLKRLGIEAAGITDVSLKQIAKLKQLERLSIFGTNCTANGMLSLIPKLPPDCIVFFNHQKLK